MATATDRRRTTRTFRIAGSAAGLVVLGIAGSTAALADDWTFTPNVTVKETLTDNLDLRILRKRRRDQSTHGRGIIDNKDLYLLHDALPRFFRYVVMPSAVNTASAGPDIRSECPM